MDIFLEIVVNPDGFVFTQTQVTAPAFLSPPPMATLDGAEEQEQTEASESSNPPCLHFHGVGRGPP